MLHAQVVFSGRVQGVGFRGRVRDAAMVEGVLGTVENMPDGTVRAIAECRDAAQLDRFIELAKKPAAGLSAARVDSAQVVELYEKAESDFASFDILR
ncbi:MAG: acylphosphatase [Candidatus Micrarchaeia archaeon]